MSTETEPQLEGQEEDTQLHVGDTLPQGEVPGHIGSWVPTGKRINGKLEWILEGIPEDD